MSFKKIAFILNLSEYEVYNIYLSAVKKIKDNKKFKEYFKDE